MISAVALPRDKAYLSIVHGELPIPSVSSHPLTVTMLLQTFHAVAMELGIPLAVDKDSFIESHRHVAHVVKDRLFLHLDQDEGFVCFSWSTWFKVRKGMSQ